MTINTLNYVLALTKSVPQFDGAVTGNRHNLVFINREGNKQNVICVANEPASYGAN